MKLLKKLYNRIIKKDTSLEYCYRHGFRSGKNFYCYSPYAIDANWPWLISVGDDVVISSDVKILAHDASTVRTGAHTKIGIVSIGNNVFIGAGSVVLCNTRVGNNVVIGAGSVVTHDVPDNSVVAGNPAKVICSFDEYQKKHLSNRETHPIFSQHRWDEWINASEEDKQLMKNSLENTFGYL